MKCPKCSYERQATDDAPDWQCPSCKVAYIKVRPTPVATPAPVQPQEPVPVRALQFELEPKVETAAPPGLGVGNVSGRDVVGAGDDDEDEDSIDEEQEERHWLAAAGQKIVIYSIIINFVLRSAEKSLAPPELVMTALFFCTAVYSLVGVLKICSGLEKTQNEKIMFMVLSFFPLVNILMLVYLSIKTSTMLREAGWKVGLLGARP